MAQMSRRRLDLLRPLNRRMLGCGQCPVTPGCLIFWRKFESSTAIARAGPGHSGSRSACCLPSEASEAQVFYQVFEQHFDSYGGCIPAFLFLPESLSPRKIPSNSSASRTTSHALACGRHYPSDQQRHAPDHYTSRSRPAAPGSRLGRRAPPSDRRMLATHARPPSPPSSAHRPLNSQERL